MARKIDPELLKRFSTVYQQRLWGGGESVSGPGSLSTSSLVLSAENALAEFLLRQNIKSIADIPCGDCNFMQKIVESLGLSYIGYDIVPGLIVDNRSRIPGLKFEQLDITADIPLAADLIFTKELFIHLPEKLVFKALSNMKASGSRFMMASNSFGVENKELEHNFLGHARPIDLMRPPYNLPGPMWNNNFYAAWDLRSIHV